MIDSKPPCCCQEPGLCERFGRVFDEYTWRQCQASEAYRSALTMVAMRRPGERPPAYERTPLGRYSPPDQPLPLVIPGVRSRVPIRSRGIRGGDWVKSILQKLGIEPCGGCHQRQALLNRLLNVPFTKWHPGACNWAVGITTAPRATYSLGRSLESLENAGWDWKAVYVFAEPDCAVPDGVRLVRRSEKFGGWRNWFVGFTQLVQENPHADVFMMLQDDVLYCRGLKEFLEESLWPDNPGKIGFVSTYTGLAQAGPDLANHDGPALRLWSQGFYWGALTYIFPPATACRILEEGDHLHTTDRKSPNYIDARLSPFIAHRGLQRWHCVPSLAQHMPNTRSSMNHSTRDGRMYSATFPGEDFDARRLLKT